MLVLPNPLPLQRGNMGMESDETQQETVLSSPDSTIALSVHRVMTMKKEEAAKGRNQSWCQTI